MEELHSWAGCWVPGLGAGAGCQCITAMLGAGNWCGCSTAMLGAGTGCQCIAAMLGAGYRSSTSMLGAGCRGWVLGAGAGCQCSTAVLGAGSGCWCWVPVHHSHAGCWVLVTGASAAQPCWVLAAGAGCWCSTAMLGAGIAQPCRMGPSTSKAQSRGDTPSRGGWWVLGPGAAPGAAAREPGTAGDVAIPLGLGPASSFSEGSGARSFPQAGAWQDPDLAGRSHEVS